MIQILGIMLISLVINNLIPGKRNNHFNILSGKNREINLIFSIITLYFILSQLLIFNDNNNEFQKRFEILGYIFGLDGIGLSLITLMGILDPILILLVKGEHKEGIERKRLINYLIIIKILIILLFSSLDLFIFFITFELILIPMFLIISRFGSKYKYFLPRLEAGIRFFMYTMVGSILMFLSIILIYIKYGTTSNELLNIKINETIILKDDPINTINLIKYIWIFLFFSFLIKIPMFPFHTWLPLAHSDAPTIGSIILAALLLKLASIGIIRYSLFVYQSSPINYYIQSKEIDKPISNLWGGEELYNQFIPIIYILAILSIIYCSFIPLRGIFDLKKIIAYSSVIHMNFSIFGFFSKNLIGLIGASFLMFTHAFISSALFLLIGILYKRYHSRFLPYFQGLSISMPLFAFFFIFFSLANISLPFCSSFLSEFFILISTIHINPFITLLLLLSLIFSSAFIIWFANRLLFGFISPYIYTSNSLTNIFEEEKKDKLGGSQDLTFTEFLTLIPFFFFTFFFTFFPQSLISLLTLPLIYFL